MIISSFHSGRQSDRILYIQAYLNTLLKYRSMRHSGNRRMLFNFKYLSLLKTLYYLFWLLSIEAKNRFDCPFFIEYNNIYNISIFRIIQIEPIGCPTRAYMTGPINKKTFKLHFSFFCHVFHTYH